VNRFKILALLVFAAAALCLSVLRPARTQTTLRRITNTTEEGININPAVSGDGRIVGFESTEDIAGVGGSDHFRAIRANILNNPATFTQMAGSRAAAPGISQDGSRIAFASKDDPLGTNADGNSEIFLFDGVRLTQVTNTSPGSLANRITNGNFQPSMSDDGRYIAFSSNRDLANQNGDGNLEIFIYDSVANTFAQLTNSSGIVGCTDAKISGDGAHIAYIRDAGVTPSAKRDLLEQGRIGGSAQILAANVQSLLMTYGRAISDDGARVVYSTETATNTTQVFLYDGRGSNAARQLTSLGSRSTEVPLNPTISGDGNRIAFATRRAVAGAASNSDGSVELYVDDIPSGTFSKITNAPSSATAEVVSSLNDDGSIVVFNFPRVFSGAVSVSGNENDSEIYSTGTPARPPFGTLTVVNDASFGNEPSTIKAVAPDSIAAARGGALANTTKQAPQNPDRSFPTNVDGTTVTVNGRAAQIFFISPAQVNFLVPSQTEVGDTADVVITNSEGFQSKGTVPILKPAPGVFTRSGDGTGEGVILNAKTLQSGPFDPSDGQLSLIIFATGARFASETLIVMGGRVVPAEYIFPEPDFPGLDEIRVNVPADLRGAGTVDLSVQSDGRASNPVAITFFGDGTRDIIINEFLADPPGSAQTDLSGDANHDGVRDSSQDEFVELVNTTGHDIDVSNYQLFSRSSSTTSDGAAKYTFAPHTIFPACTSFVIFGGGSPDPSNPVFGGAQVVKTGGGLSLTNTGGVITLRNSSNGVVTSLPYGGNTGINGNASQSVTRSPDVSGAYTLHSAATGAAGRLFSPGTRVNGTAFTVCPPIARVDVSPATATIDQGAKQQFTAKAYDSSGNEVSGVIFSWQSSDTNIATIDQNGLATSFNPGSTQIRATGRGVTSAPATLTVRAVERVLTRVDVSPSSATIPATGAQQFTAHGFDQFNNEIAGLTFTWESTNTSVATIDTSGLATGINQGQSTIKATSGGVTGTATLNVTAPTIVVNEVLANPPTGTDGDANHDGTRSAGDDEFLELVNSTGAGINISGWTVRTHPTGNTSETTRHTFASTTLPAGEALVVFGGGTFNPADPVFGCAQVVKASSGALSLTDSGLTVLIRDSSGNLVTQFSYGGSTGLNGGNSQSLTRSPDITGNFVQHTTIAGARKFSPGLKVDGTPFGNCPGHPASVTIAPPSATANIGNNTQFTAQAFDQFGRAMIGVPITFNSDNTTVATIDSTSTNPMTGVATANVGAHIPGTAHITATANDGTTTATSPQATLTVNGPALSINDVTLNEGDETTTAFNFVVSLSQPAGAGGVTFNIATQDNTATAANNDYVPRSLTNQTIPAGQQTYNFAVTVNGDGSIEPNESFFVNVTNVSGASVTDSQGVGTILNDDSPTLSVSSVSTSEGNSGITTFAFTVSSNIPAPSGGITFDITTVDGSATAPGDYTARTLTGQSIPAGQQSYTFNVDVKGDTVVEPDENFIVRISNPSGGGAVIGNSDGTGTIVNDDTAAVVISQVYGGGGNSGAQFKNDFIEVFNRGTTTVSLNGYSVQYAGDTSGSWSKTDLTNVALAPGGYYLIQEAAGSGSAAAPPTPDVTGTINLSASAGKVALVSNTTLLSGACPTGASIVDLVGYGTTASCFEGSAHAPTHSNTTADFRKSGGCVDTNDNAADFLTAAPNPRNTASALNDCSTGFRPDITINDVSVAEGDTGTKTVDFTVTLSAPNNSQTVTVNFATADGTANAGSDYQSSSGTVTFNPGQTSKPVTITINGDTAAESNETFFVNLSNAVNASILDPQGQGTITNDDIPPTLTINDVSLNEGNSGTTTFHFVVSLSAPALAGGVTFDIATQDNTATTADNDYVARNLTNQSISAGQQTYGFDVTVNGDVNIEPNESFLVNVTNVTGATVGDAQGVGTILTDDSPVLNINDVSATEGNSGTTTFTFTVTSTLPAPSGGISFDINTLDNTATVANNDYVARSLTNQTIPAGSTTYMFDVTVDGDTSVEPDESFFVKISNASGGGAVIGGTGQGTGTILNDDAAQLVISQVYGGGNNSGAQFQNDFVEIFNRGNTTVDFAVTPYSIQYASVGSNFGGTTASAKTNLTSGMIAPGKYFLVQESGGITNGVPLPAPDATGSIALAATLGKVALVAGTGALGTAACPGDDLVSPFNPVDGTIADFVGYGSTATTSGHCYEGPGPATAPSNTTVDLRKAGGCTDTGNNTADFLVSAPFPRNSSSPANNCSGGAVPNLTINDVTVIEGNSGTATATFTVSLSAPAQGADVTFDIATQDNTATTANNDYVAKTSTGQIIPAGQTTYSFSVTVNGDVSIEPDETFFVNVTNVAGANVTDGQGLGTITNDDLPILSISDVPPTVEGNSGTKLFTFTVSLTAPAGAGGVTFDIASQDGTATVADNDYQTLNLTGQTITAGNSTKTFDVVVNGDMTNEPDETFLVNVSNISGANSGDVQGQGTILNDDTPTLSINSVTVTEGNSGTTPAMFTVTLSPTSTQTVTVDYATANGTAIGTGTGGTDYQSTSGTLTFTPGQATQPITVLVNGDTTNEAICETFFVNLSNAANATISPSAGQGGITDDDGSKLIITQIYGGGSNAGATFQNDFVELFNRGATTIDFAVTPYSVQYASAAGSFTIGNTINLTTGTVAAGQYFLIKLAPVSPTIGAALPTPDATNTGINMSATDGKVALVLGTTVLSACPGATISDLVGYGSANCSEGTATAVLSATKSARRTASCTDTNSNSADFTVVSSPAAPRNTATALSACSCSTSYASVLILDRDPLRASLASLFLPDSYRKP
jgi:hypothetical protein